MKTARTVWGIDIGQSALRGMKLRSEETGVGLDAFEVIEHPTILSQPEADRRDLIGGALRQFRQRADLSACHVVASVPGEGACCHFAHLPPVDGAEVPKVVRFEAEQQLPCPLEEVFWRWQTFRDLERLDAPDVDAAIFAVPRRDVGEMLLLLSQADITVDAMQIAPLALYNFMVFDGQLADDGATLLADLGAGTLDLVVADGRRIWIRTVPLGGSRLAEAPQSAVADAAAEIKRAIADYTSHDRECRFGRIIALGSGFGAAGMLEAVERDTGVPVVRIDSYRGYRRLGISPGTDLSRFNDSAASLAVAYGLAIQGLGLATVHANFLPEGIARRRGWPESPGKVTRWLQRHFPGLFE